MSSRRRSTSPTRRSTASRARSASPVPLETQAQHHQLQYDHDKFEGPHSFGGVVGTAGLVILLPIIIISLKVFCEPSFCFERLDLQAAANAIPRDWSAYLSWQVTAVYFGWILYMAACERFLPSYKLEGLPLRDGTRLSYRMNGHLTMWVTIVLLDHWKQLGITSATLSWVYDHYLQLAVISIISAAVLSVYLYIKSFAARGAHLAIGGNTGYPTYDFFMGRELNPRWFGGSFDIKVFVEMRLGMIGWVVLNLAMVAKQYESQQQVSTEMLMVFVFQLVYTWDSLYLEHALLSTHDITTEGLGYMLTFGDMVWIPFGFSVQTRYLVDHSPHLPAWVLCAIALLFAGGYYVFRGANSQKDLFRTNPLNPKVSHLKTMKTKRGTALLVSGFWGLARKINYTGDLMIALAFCLPCGFSSVIPYFYFVYLFSLLMHRAIRDDQACAAKYGDDWIEYKKQVPYVFIPYVV